MPARNLHVGIRRAQLVDLVEIDALVVAVVVGEGDFLQAAFARALSAHGWSSSGV